VVPIRNRWHINSIIKPINYWSLNSNRGENIYHLESLLIEQWLKFPGYAFCVTGLRPRQQQTVEKLYEYICIFKCQHRSVINMIHSRDNELIGADSATWWIYGFLIEGGVHYVDQRPIRMVYIVKLGLNSLSISLF